MFFGHGKRYEARYRSPPVPNPSYGWRPGFCQAIPRVLTVRRSAGTPFGAPERRTAFRQTSKPSKLAESLGRNLSATHTMDLVPGASDIEAHSAYRDRKTRNCPEIIRNDCTQCRPAVFIPTQCRPGPQSPLECALRATPAPRCGLPPH